MARRDESRNLAVMTAERTEPMPDDQRTPLVMRALRELWRMATDAPFRHVTLMRLIRRKGSFQPFNDTRENRYPGIFGFVQSQLGVERTRNILSFGCSTGEEVFSLRNYFPAATIKGIDINPGNIALCRRRLEQTSDLKISFALGDSTRAEPSAAYDAIFCMAVLRHGSLGDPGVTRCDHLLRFDDFAATVADFGRCLKPGGLLIIRHSNFRLCDAPAGADFDAIFGMPFSPGGKRTPIFGPDNQLMAGVEYPDTVFRKSAAV